MSRKIKLHLFTALFRFFAFWADKTNGWCVFVKPKLLFGSLIIGLGMASCQQPGSKKENTESKSDSVEIHAKMDTLDKAGSVIDSVPALPPIEISRYDMAEPVPPPPPLITCYEIIEISDSTLKKNPDSSSVQNVEVEELCYVIVENYPEYPGGNVAMMKFISENMKFPELHDTQIGGRIVCEFVIEPDSTVSNVKIIKGLHPEIDAEVLRVVQSMPKWMPGRQRGKAVRVKFTLPINISFQQ